MFTFRLVAVLILWATSCIGCASTVTEPVYLRWDQLIPNPIAARPAVPRILVNCPIPDRSRPVVKHSRFLAFSGNAFRDTLRFPVDQSTNVADTWASIATWLRKVGVTFETEAPGQLVDTGLDGPSLQGVMDGSTDTFLVRASLNVEDGTYMCEVTVLYPRSPMGVGGQFANAAVTEL